MTLPGEWTPQDAILLAWPTERTDWADTLEQAQACFIDIIEAIVRFEPVVLCVDSEATLKAVAPRLPESATHPVHLLTAPYNDTWVRDSGPLTLLDADGSCQWLDFRFDAWGGKFAHDRDNELVAAIHRDPLFAHLTLKRFDWVLEGGAIESDGQGTLLTTAQCLERRYPQLTREQIEQRLCECLHVERVLWIENGELLGDDTDGHVDTLARLADPGTIVYQGCRDRRDAHFAPLAGLRSDLAAMRTAAGKPYRLIELPLPSACHDRDGRRLPAGYANFLILNNAVIVPTYQAATDEAALAVLATTFPDRQIVGVDCAALITQGGSLHCATMQLPRGTLRSER